MSGSTQRAIALAIGISGGIMFSGHATATWYVGLGGGLSRLSPDTEGSAFTLYDDQAETTYAYVGLDINDWLSAEAAFTDLGEAELSGGQSIEYTSASIGGIAYVYRNRGKDERQSGLSGYLRLGLNSISNESDILLNEADNTSVWVGAGIQYPLGQRFGLRAEISSYDGDAQAALASLYWRGKADPGSFRGRVGQEPPSVERVNDEFQDSGVVQAEPFGGFDTDTDLMTGGGLTTGGGDSFGNSNFDIASSASCDEPALGEPTDEAGCALFTGIVEGVEFLVGSPTLTPDSEFLLEGLARSMNTHPNLVIELQAHTESFAEPGRDMQVSRERVREVASYLVGQGVNVQRLRARAFGSAQPRFQDNSTESRRLNNRISLRVL